MPSKQPAMNVRDAAEIKSDVVETYDAVVIGSGAGGAVIAKELAEGGMKVVILEEGGYHRDHHDLAFESLDRLYRDKGLTVTLGTPLIPIPIGKCFGGTTVVNSGTCFRTPNHILKRWQDERRLTELGGPELDKAFSRVEKIINVEPADFAVMSRSNTLMAELLQKEGFKGAPIQRNVKNCQGDGMCCYGCESGAKQSMDMSYLPLALAAGAVAYTHAKATRILTDPKAGGAACGVVAEAVDKGSRALGPKLTFKSKITILAAGTFHTPQLLRQSGIARKNRHLGRHLTIHPATKVFAEFDQEIKGWKGTAQAYYLDTFQKEGLMFEGIFTPPDLTPLTLPFVGTKLIEFMKRYSHITSFALMISDQSEGRLIRLPLFGYTYLYTLSQADVRRFQKGIGFLARIFLKGGAKRVFPILHKTEFSCLEDVDRFERRHLLATDVDAMAFHPLGTCRMAVSAKEGVCDQQHHVFGTPQLYICDGSVIPTSIAVNPQLTIMAFATRLASLILRSPLRPV